MARDAKKVVQCWTQAAEYGDMDAQYNLGVMYATGRGVDKDLARAVHL
jgi:TPR repeat protein